MKTKTKKNANENKNENTNEKKTNENVDDETNGNVDGNTNKNDHEYKHENINNNENDAKNNKENRNEKNGKYWYIHRKGAAPSDNEYNNNFVIIPGSRGSYSYIVKARPNEASAFSVAHGAGRQWMRSKAINKMSKWYPNPSTLSRTDVFGSYVICENKDLMYEECPQAYKNIDSVIHDLQYFNLITIVAILKPIITYKTKIPLGK